MRWMLASIASFVLLLCSGSFAAQGAAPQPVHLFVVVASYNNSRWCEDSLESVFSQTYQNWSMYYVDDCSTDGMGPIVDRYVKKRGMGDKCRIVHNSTRLGAMENQYNAVHAADPHDVVVILDGDDRFADMYALQTVADTYADPEVWLTYGSFNCEPGGWKGGCAPLPRDVLANASIRSYVNWITSHLRTFYAALFHKIKKDDLMAKGKFFEIACDVATFVPMIEMASPNHVRYIDRVLYFYNYSNPLSDSYRREYQLATDRYIRTLPPYKPLANPFE